MMKKNLMILSLMVVSLFAISLVSAAHTSTVTIDPSGWLKPSTTEDFELTVTNDGTSSVKEVIIDIPGGFSNLDCGDAPTDWNIIVDNGDTCSYRTTIDLITTGNSEVFTLQVDTSSTSGDETWMVVSKDIGENEYLNNPVSVVKTIQSEIDAASPGDIIIVPAGTYEELITINKPLILQGAGVGDTIMDMSSLGNPSVREKVIIVDVDSGDVTIDGFEIILGDNMDGIDSSSGDSSSTLTISNNKITGYGDVACNDLEDFGIYVHHSAFNAIISDNEIDTNCNPILVERLTGETTITGNTLYAKDNSAGIAFMTYSGTDVTSLQSISDNTITVSENDQATGGIMIRTSPWWIQGDGEFTDVEIIDNTITNVLADTYGIKILNDKDDTPETAEINGVTISGNTISGSAGTRNNSRRISR